MELGDRFSIPIDQLRSFTKSLLQVHLMVRFRIRTSFSYNRCDWPLWQRLRWSAQDRFRLRAYLRFGLFLFGGWPLVDQPLLLLFDLWYPFRFFAFLDFLLHDLFCLLQLVYRSLQTQEVFFEFFQLICHFRLYCILIGLLFILWVNFWSFVICFRDLFYFLRFYMLFKYFYINLWLLRRTLLLQRFYRNLQSLRCFSWLKCLLFWGLIKFTNWLRWRLVNLAYCLSRRLKDFTYCNR